MSKSTLPQLFKSDIFKIKFHPDEKPRKIGGRFTIKPSGYHVKQQSTERSVNNKQLNRLQVNYNNGYYKSIYEGVEGKQHRSQSISNIPSGVVNNDFNYKQKSSFIRQKKSPTITNPNIISPYNQQISHIVNNPTSQRIIRKPSFSSYQSDTLTLKQIHNQNIIRNQLYSTTMRINHQPSSRFPYQQSKSINNMTIDMQEADSLRHRVEVIVEQQENCQSILSQIQQQAQTITHHLAYLHTAHLHDLTQFTTKFTQQCKTLLSTLSKLRRQTSQQIRQNIFDIDRLGEDYSNAFQIFNMIDERCNILRGQCIDDKRLELTNRKTYELVEIEKRVQQSVRESELGKLMKRTKRSSTSHTNNNNKQQQCMAIINKELPINTTLKQQAQTLSCKKNHPVAENEKFERDTNNKLQQIQLFQVKSPIYSKPKQSTHLNQKQQQQSSSDSLDIAIDVESYQLPTLKEYVLDDY